MADWTDDVRELLTKISNLPQSTDQKIDELAARLKDEVKGELDPLLAEVDTSQLLELLTIVDNVGDRRLRWLAFGQLIAWVESRRVGDEAGADTASSRRAAAAISADDPRLAEMERHFSELFPELREACSRLKPPGSLLATPRDAPASPSSLPTGRVGLRREPVRGSV